jgi:hypothetical protein
MKRLFVAGSPLQLMFASSVAAGGGDDHVWLQVPWAVTRLGTGMQALLDGAEWKSSWLVPLGDGYGIDGRSMFRQPLSSAARLAAAERLTRLLLDRVGPLEEVLITNQFTPFHRLLHEEGRARGARVSYVEDGFVVYLDSHYGARNYGSKVRFSGRLKDVAIDGYLSATGRRHRLRGANDLDFDDAYLFFPNKPHSVRGRTKALGPLLKAWFVQHEGLIGELRSQSVGAQQAIERGSGAVVVLGQSVAEDLVMPRELQVRLMRVLLERLSRRFELVLYKPHPRDADDKTTSIMAGVRGAHLFQERGAFPIELLIGDSRVACVGIWTAALAYLPQLGGQSTYSILPWLVRECDAAGVEVPKLARILEEIAPRFSEELRWIDDLDQIRPD